MGARQGGGLGAGALGSVGVREAHDGALGAVFWIGADHRNSSSSGRDCGLHGVDGDGLVVHRPGPRLETELGGAAQVGVSEDGVHLASLGAKRAGPSEQRRRALGPGQRLERAVRCP